MILEAFLALFPPPGALNPAVNQATIHQTICVRGWTATIRPPIEFTSALKRQQMVDRSLPGRPGDYEEDHLIPLELGGAPSDPANLWPEPWADARLKDELESELRREVCAGRLSLSAAQEQIRTWRRK